MSSGRIVNARLLPSPTDDGRSPLIPMPGRFSVSWTGGLIDRVTPQDEEAAASTTGAGKRPIAGAGVASDSGAAEVIDAGGALLLPALVDAHLHPDLSYSRDRVEVNRSGTLSEAISHWAAAKCEMTQEDVACRALRCFDAEFRAGTGTVRAHVDVSSGARLRLLRGVLDAASAYRDRMRIQLVAFPQDGLKRDPHALNFLSNALRAGCTHAGGIPHVERSAEDSLMHLKLVFLVAEQNNADVDVHIDETDHPDSRCTEMLADLTIEYGWQGRVTASHVCALASYPEDYARRVIDRLAEARIRVVTNPGVNLHLQGRGDGYPRRRGLTRVRDLLDAGVRCAAGQDCIRDPFYPLGNGRMLDQAFLLVHAEHMDSDRRMRTALEMVSGMAAEVVGDGARAVAVGEPADLVLFAAEDATHLLAERPLPLLRVHAGRVVLRTIAGGSASSIRCTPAVGSVSDAAGS
ncbi:MAG: amidohydrolase family protein [Phycisphaerales bacterium]|nr:amidohydrolase family protein [Phycisphaerales bacterium]